MKKLLVLMVAFIGLSLNTMGQTASCKISGGQDGATVVASITEVGDGYVMVSADNDGTFDVNVSISITGKFHGKTSAKVRKDQTATIKVPVSGAKKGDDTDAYNISVSGTRCN